MIDLLEDYAVGIAIALDGNALIRRVEAVTARIWRRTAAEMFP